MDKLFYTEQDKTAFWVAGYWTDGSGLVSEVIKSLNDGADQFAAMAGVEPQEVKTLFISTSRRYKYMRVFYANVDKAPDGFFSIAGTDWNMYKWLQD